MENRNARVALHEVVGPLNDLNQKFVGKEGERWLTEFKKFLRKESTWNDFISKPYRVFLEHKTIEEAVKADSGLLPREHVNNNSFKVLDSDFGKRDIYLIHFNYSIEFNEAIEEMNKIGMRPASIMELLALGAEYPNLQRNFEIVALGSVYDDGGWSNTGTRFVPFLSEDNSKFRVVIVANHEEWHAYYRFAAVYK